MARHKDREWSLPDGRPTDGGGTVHDWESLHAAILMDIRDELKQLNALLGCSNFRAIPRVLRTIYRNTAKPRQKARR